MLIIFSSTFKLQHLKLLTSTSQLPDAWHNCWYILPEISGQIPTYPTVMVTKLKLQFQNFNFRQQNIRRPPSQQLRLQTNMRIAELHTAPKWWTIIKPYFAFKTHFFRRRYDDVDKQATKLAHWLSLDKVGKTKYSPPQYIIHKPQVPLASLQAHPSQINSSSIMAPPYLVPVKNRRVGPLIQYNCLGYRFSLLMGLKITYSCDLSPKNTWIKK